MYIPGVWNEKQNTNKNKNKNKKNPKTVEPITY